MKIRGTLNLRKLSLFMLAAAAVVSTGPGEAKAQQYVDAIFRNSSNALVYWLIITRADNRSAYQGNFLTTSIKPGEELNFQVDATTCMFHVSFLVTEGSGALQGVRDFCKAGWTITYRGIAKSQTSPAPGSPGSGSGTVDPKLTAHNSCLTTCMYQGLMYEQHDTYGCNYACLLEYNSK
jgi:hypothetical protein